MNRRDFAARTSATALLWTAAASTARAETYPDRPIKLVVPFAPGGGADIVARIVAVPLSARLGQPLVVENKPGGGGTLAADLVAKAPADGYTVLYTTPGPQITNPYLMAKLPYDPAKDLIPVGEVSVPLHLLIVNPSVPARNLKELIAYARANPGKLSFASAGAGSSSHLAGEMLKHRANIDILHVPYRGTGAALQDLVGGNVSMTIDSLSVYRAMLEAGSVRALAVATATRSPLLPDLPPIADDLPGFEASPINYLTVRSGTPADRIMRLNRELNAVLASPEIQRKLVEIGVEARPNSPSEMAALIRTEAAKWQKVIQESGARAE